MKRRMVGRSMALGIEKVKKLAAECEGASEPEPARSRQAKVSF